MTVKKTITDNQIVRVVEKPKRRKKVEKPLLTLHKLLRASTINTVLSEIDSLPSLSDIIVIAKSGEGRTIHHTGLKTDTMIAELEKAKILIIDDELFEDADNGE